MEYQPKSNEKYTPFLDCISSFEGTFYKKNLRCSCQVFYFLLFYISFYNIQHYQKRTIFAKNFPFLTDSLKLPQPP